MTALSSGRDLSTFTNIDYCPRPCVLLSTVFYYYSRYKVLMRNSCVACVRPSSFPFLNGILLCNLLSQSHHCYLCPNSINMCALQQDTHSVDEINILYTPAITSGFTNTHTRCLTALIRCFTRISMSGRQFKWFIEGFAPTDLTKAKLHKHPHAGVKPDTQTHTTYSSKGSRSLQSAQEQRGMSFWMVSRCTSPTSVVKLQACGKDGLLGPAECPDLEMKPSQITNSSSLLFLRRNFRRHNEQMYCSAIE